MEPWRLLLSVLLVFSGFFGFVREGDAKHRRILFDTDVNSDDIYALIYFLKQNRSEIDLEAITISANAFSNAGHAVNHIYDVLHMMDRDDIPVGVGGEGGILPNGTILANVGGYLPLIEQDMSTAGNCRYRQAIYRGEGGFLSVDTNYGLRRKFLPMGDRHYSPLRQPTAQKVMIDAISAGPITVFLSGSHTNLAIFLMTQPHLKQNIEHIYVMGGGVRSKNPFGCCTEDSATSCEPSQFCGDIGNLYTGQASNPYAEFNIFTDPFAAYQVFHSGIPLTLVPLDATNTIPVNEHFFAAFQQHRSTYEAEYCFQMLKIIRDTWFDDSFYESYFMWDSFAAGVTVSSMKNEHHDDENEFAEMEYMNLTVVTSNKPYGVYDGSNPFFDSRATPKFGLLKNGVHSGHVQTELHDPFCHVDGIEKGICQDGYTKEENGTAVRVLVATKAKLNHDKQSILDRKFYASFLNALNQPQQSARFNRTAQLPYHRDIVRKPSYKHKVFGKPVVFDMDMSVGDLVALFYLLKVPVEEIDVKGILVNGNGWANAATIDIVYDVLHMMGRDDIPVGLGSFTALGAPSHSCKYVKAIPHGSGGLIDSDTLFGLARNLPRSPRRYTVEDDRQASAMEVWQMISRSVSQNNTINILTNGPLTNIANIILSDENASSVIQRIYIVGGHVIDDQKKGNVFTNPSNEYAEFNMFLDPLAAKTVIESKLDVTLIPLDAQRKVTSFRLILKQLQQKLKTSESVFVHHLLSRLHNLQKRHKAYNHMDIFLGEILGAVFMVDSGNLNPIIKAKPVNILAGNINTDGQIVVNEGQGKIVDVLESLHCEAYYNIFANLLGEKKQSAAIGSFAEQKRMWRMPHNAS